VAADSVFPRRCFSIPVGSQTAPLAAANANW
jgi:hypothetical protein